MKRLIALSALLIVILSALSLVMAQDDEAEPVLVQAPVSSGVEILYPASVSEVWGTAHAIGTANVDNMAYYYFEGIQLNDDLSIPPNASWIPLTVGLTEPVERDVLAVFDTTNIDDGIYAIRLVVNTQDGTSYEDTVGPIRVSNQLNVAIREFAAERGYNPDLSNPGREDIIMTPDAEEPTEEPEATAEPTEAPPTNNSPRVVTDSRYVSPNVRYCDITDNDQCPVVGHLDNDIEAPVFGISSRNTGWYQIRLPAGVIGWISPTVVDTLGDFSGLPRISPPTPLPKPTVAPTNNPTNLAFPNGMSIVGGVAECGTRFTVHVNITNQGTTVTPAGVLTVQAVAVAYGVTTYSNVGNYPSLNPGGNYVVAMPVTISTFPNSTHELRAFTNNRKFVQNIFLEGGNCVAQPTPTTAPESRYDFPPGTCAVQTVPNAALYSAPFGSVIASAPPAPSMLSSNRLRIIDGVYWYRQDGTGYWIRGNSNHIVIPPPPSCDPERKWN